MFWDLPRFGKSGPAFRLVRIRLSLQRPWQDLQPEAAGNWLYKGSNLCIISYSSRSASTKAVFPAAFSSLALMTRAGGPRPPPSPGDVGNDHRPAATTAPRPTRTPLQDDSVGPTSTSSSMTTGVALAGSMTPARTAPAPHVAVFAHGGPATQDRAHVDHGALSHNGPDV